MKTFLSLCMVSGLLSLVSAGRKYDNGTVWTTEIVTAYTTYCPSPTVVVQNNQTYTVTSPTLLTITNCPCTISTMVPTGSGGAILPTGVSTPVPTPSTTAVGGGGGAGGGSGGSATTSSGAGSTASGGAQSSDAGSVTVSFVGLIIAVGMMAGLM